MASTNTAARDRAALEIDARNRVARQDLATAFAAIYTPRVVGQRLYIETSALYHGVVIRISGPEIDPTDLGVLLSIVTIAGSAHSNVRPGAECGSLLPHPPAEHDGRAKPNAAAGEGSVMVETSIHAIATMIGRDGRDGQAARAIRASLRRLMSIVISAERGEEWGITHLLRSSVGRGGSVEIDLNYRATRAVTGEGQWAPLDMTRFRDAGPLERILMHRLAAHCVGHPLLVTIDRLVEVCWTRPPKNAADKRKRRQLIRNALPRCLPAGVSARVSARGAVTFKRCTEAAA